jgi:seryl-tRNA synthetase
MSSPSPFLCASCKWRHLLRQAPHRQFSWSQLRKQDVRPPTAPKQFPDIRAIRANPDLYAQNCLQRNYKAHAQAPAKIALLGAEVRELDSQLREPRSRIKRASRDFAAKNNGPQQSENERAQLLAEVASIRVEVDRLEKRKTSCEEESHTLALSLPNLTSPHTPTNDSPKLIKYVNYDPENPLEYPETADHSHIGKELELLDFTSASTTTGWGFYYLMNEAALLEQALIQYALSVARSYGWQAVSPPSLVYSHIADACGFQPRDQNDEQQIWQVAQSEKDVGKPKRSLAATAEIPLAGLHASKAIAQDALPIKLVGSSRCFRAEAGARGVDTKGLYRVHEFTKVEMFAWTQAETLAGAAEPEPASTTVFNEMVDIQTKILTSLDLPFRILEMPSSDLGASAFRKIDIEAFFPSRRKRDDGWGEVTSASICTDYQSRRLDTRIADKSGARMAFPHTVNGTALAVPRVLAAILENHWNEDQGCVKVPPVLRQYLGGIESIGPR